MKQTFFALISALLLCLSCTTTPQSPSHDSDVLSEEPSLPGDSTVYGLACEGCTDSVIVFLPFTGGDPDTLDILAAREHHRVFGRPDIGDELAILRSGTDPTVADMVLNLERLKGEWCYQAMPKLKLPAGTDATRLPPLPDSLRQKWLQPREYGFEIKRDFTARPIGPRTSATDKQSPVEYPTLKRYREWHLLNGRLLLSETRLDSLGNAEVTGTDTAEITLLRRDSLVLRFADGEQGYYKKQ